MAVHWRLECAVWHDSISPRDAAVINPCFRDTTNITGPQGLCDSMASGLAGFVTTAASHQIRVRAYDLEGSKPVHFAAEKVLAPNAATAANYPRELAICLSFYSGTNTPRKRGRLYIPYYWAGAAPIGLRPTTTDRTIVGNYVPLLAGLGGVDVDWIVWSHADGVARKVSNWWVDDEWDIQRRRGLRPTTRSTGSTGG